jgi:hypothetical protein
MEENILKVCRKCATSNREDNVYCKKCGAVLDVQTTAVKAQKKPVVPQLKEMRWRYVLVGVFVMLGVVSLMSAVAFFTGQGLGFGSLGIDGFASEIIRTGAIAAGLFFVAFALSGAVLTWLAKSRITREVTVAVTLVLAVLGVVGSLLTDDALIVAGLLWAPSVAFALLGARLTRNE